MAARNIHPNASGSRHLTTTYGISRADHITNDVLHADVAQAKGANFAPRLAFALPVGKPAALTNFKRASLFASAPFPMGSASRDAACSPLRQMVRVTWLAGRTPQTLKSEEAVLAAADSGAVVLEPTSVVLNCPIVHRGTKGALPGVLLLHPLHCTPCWRRFARLPGIWPGLRGLATAACDRCRVHLCSRVRRSANEMPMADSTNVMWTIATMVTIWMLSILRSPLR